MNNIQNGEITSTHLGLEDHDIFTVLISIQGDSWGCGFGGYKSDKRGLSALLLRFMEIAGVKTWEELPGTYVRAEFDGNMIIRIGHLMEDKWIARDDIGKVLLKSEDKRADS